MERLSELVKSQKRGNLHFCEYIEQLLSNEKYEQASTLCLGELENNYNNSQVFMLLGKALRCQSQCNDAENAFLYAIQLDPYNTDAHYELGRLRGEMHSYHRSNDIHKQLTGHYTVKYNETILYSCFNEQTIIRGLLSKLEGVVKFFVDIGAGDGVTFSNTYPLVLDGWKGVCLEADGDQF